MGTLWWGAWVRWVRAGDPYNKGQDFKNDVKKVTYTSISSIEDNY